MQKSMEYSVHPAITIIAQTIIFQYFAKAYLVIDRKGLPHARVQARKYLSIISLGFTDNPMSFTDFPI